MGYRFDNRYTVDIVFGMYGNGNTAIQLMGSDDSEYPGEAILVATVNPEETFGDPALIAIKSWTLYDETVDFLCNAGIIKKDPIRNIESGYSYMVVYEMTDEGLNMFEEQMLERASY